MTTGTNGTVKRVVLAVAATVIGALTLFGLGLSSRMTSIEQQVQDLRGWVKDTRDSQGSIRLENNNAHAQIEAEIKDQGKTMDAKLTEILKEMKK